MTFGALILAAGYSSRMGGFKPLLKLGGATLLAHGANRFRTAGIDNIVVVAGYRAADVEAEAKRLGIRWLSNPDYKRGMFASVQAGVACMRHCDGFFLLPVDIPLFHAATVTTLLDRFDGQSVLVPTYEGEQGHPPLIPGHLAGVILSSSGRGGLRALLVRQAVRSVEVWDRGILLDADTPEAFTALQNRFDTLAAGELEKQEARRRALILAVQELVEAQAGATVAEMVAGRELP